MTMSGGGDAQLWADDSDDELLAQVDLSETAIADATTTNSRVSPPPRAVVPLLSLIPPDTTPLMRLRRGYLWVSDLVSQTWCEQQLVYRLALPAEVKESQAMTAGSSLHLARELEVQEYVQVEVTSDEDIFAVKVVNLLHAVKNLRSGGAVCREVPIFGAPFGQDIFFLGKIDEIRTDPKTFELELVELKTRTVKSLPSKAQGDSHKVQVMLYKRLFDDLVRGNLTKEKISEVLNLDLKKELSGSIMEHVLSVDESSGPNLDALLQRLFDQMQSLTCIRSIQIEYCYQKDGETIGYDPVSYDETWFKPIFDKYAMFWKGKRQACGVEIEEAWKCQKCDFAEVCEWRDSKSKECVAKNPVT